MTWGPADYRRDASDQTDEHNADMRAEATTWADDWHDDYQPTRAELDREEFDRADERNREWWA